MSPTLHIHLLGGFRLFEEHKPFVLINRPRQQALMAYLLLHRHTSPLRQQLAFTFWPDSSERQAYTNLRKLFFQVRQALPAANLFLAADALSLGWRNDAPFTLDVAEVDQALDQIEKGATPTLEAVERVIVLYQGELLPNCYDDWILPIRRALHERVVNTLTNAIHGLQAQHEYTVGLHTAEHLRRLDPLHETTYRHLMSLRALNGDRTGALRSYHECVRVLAQELGVSPATETQALYQQLLKAAPQVKVVSTSVSVPHHEQIPLVGRKRERQVLQQAWEQMTRRGPQFLTIWGDAGVGKTRLVEELLQWAKLRAGSVVYARSYAAEGVLSYAPITAWLRSKAVRKEVTSLDTVWQTEIARLLPELLIEQPTLPPPVPMTEGWQRHHFYEALARAVFALPLPRLLVLDDLQWCDGETLAWLRYLLRFDATAPFLVIGTVRAEAVAMDHPLHDLRQQLQREAQWTEVELTPLSVEETAVLAGHLTQEDVTSWRTRLYQETEGNPLFIVETVRAGYLARPSGGQEAQAHALPPTVQAVITTRLAQLSRPAQQLVQIAATIGRAFAVEVLAAATELDEDSLVQALDELWQRHIVREQVKGYDFSHDKIREVTYAQVTPMRRRWLHNRVANALVLVYASTLNEVSGSVAAHFVLAGNPAKAVAYFTQAGENAISTSYSMAIDYFSRALMYIHATDHEGRVHLLLQRGRLFMRFGRLEASRADLQNAYRGLEGMSEALPQRAKVYVEANCCLSYVEREEGDFARAASYAFDALQWAKQSGVPEQMASAHYHWGQALRSQGKAAEAKTQLTEALYRAKQSGNETLEALALEELSATGMFSGMAIADVLGYLDECLIIYERKGDLRGLVDVHHKYAYGLMSQGTGEYQQAHTHIEEAVTLFNRLDFRLVEANIYRNLGTLYTIEGDYAAAHAQLTRTLTLSQENGRRYEEGIILNYLGYWCYNTGDLAQARHYQEQALELLKAMGGRERQVKPLNGLSQIHFVLGNYEHACTYAEQSLQLCREIGESREEAQALTCIGYARLGQGRLAEATAAFRLAYQMRSALEQTNRSMEPLAGLALVTLSQGDNTHLSSWIEPIFQHIQSHIMDCTEDTFQVYWACYQALRTLGDPRIMQALRIAHEQLARRASTLADENQQRMFWAVPSHLQILQAMS